MALGAMVRKTLPRLYAVALLVTLLDINVVATENATCVDLGFTGQSVCSDCDILQQHVSDDALVQECRACCIDDKDDRQIQRFSSASLIVCPYRLKAYGQIKEFVDKHAKKHKALTVKYLTNSSPKLVMKGKDGKESVRIDNWKIDTIKEYLAQRLS